MSPYPPPGQPPGQAPDQGGFGRSVEEAVERIEAELRQAVAYVNETVVPQVRRESITAMRTMADTLRNLADRFEASSRPGPVPPNPAPPNSAPSNPSKDPRS